MAVLPSILYTMLQPIQVPESINLMHSLRVLVIENAELGVHGLHHVFKLPSLQLLQLRCCGTTGLVLTRD